MANRLTLYRRHRTGRAAICIRQRNQHDKVFHEVKYASHLRVHEPTTKKMAESQDCECPIVAEGSLHREPGRIRYRSLDTCKWAEAKEIAANWLSWGATTPPPPPQMAKTIEPEPQGITIEAAVKRFLSFMDEWGWSDDYQGHFRVLLNQRLIPWAQKHGIEYLEALSDLDLATAFVYSWVNLNPLRNRKCGSPLPIRKLGRKTQQNERTRFSHFMMVALKYGWVAANRVPTIRIGKKKQRMAPDEPLQDKEQEERYGLTRPEYGRVVKKASEWTSPKKRQELEALVPLLRESGLRISDAATLDLSEIIPRRNGRGYGIYLQMMKTRAWVYVPIPDYLYELLMSLPIKGEANGKRYLFWTGKGRMRTCVKNFSNDVAELMHRAQDPKDTRIQGMEANYLANNYLNPFSHPASTHTLRHTFATLALEDGSDITDVQQMLGHKKLATTQRFYEHASIGRQKLIDEKYDNMLARRAASLSNEERSA